MKLIVAVICPEALEAVVTALTGSGARVVCITTAGEPGADGSVLMMNLEECVRVAAADAPRLERLASEEALTADGLA
jgi:hypothetical protein